MSEARKKITLPYLFEKVAKGEPITWLTCYDYPTAYLQEQAGIEMILVGDSLGMTMLGYESTLPVTMEDMIRHSQAVRRGAQTAFVVGDMPYMTYQPSVETAIRNAGRFMAEAGCDAIKLEGGAAMADRIQGHRRCRNSCHWASGTYATVGVSPGRVQGSRQGCSPCQEDRGRCQSPGKSGSLCHPARNGPGRLCKLITETGGKLHHHVTRLRT